MQNAEPAHTLSKQPLCEQVTKSNTVLEDSRVCLIAIPSHIGLLFNNADLCQLRCLV